MCMRAAGAAGGRGALAMLARGDPPPGPPRAAAPAPPPRPAARQAVVQSSPAAARQGPAPAPPPAAPASVRDGGSAGAARLFWVQLRHSGSRGGSAQRAGSFSEEGYRSARPRAARVGPAGAAQRAPAIHSASRGRTPIKVGRAPWDVGGAFGGGGTRRARGRRGQHCRGGAARVGGRGGATQTGLGRRGAGGGVGPAAPARAPARTRQRSCVGRRGARAPVAAGATQRGGPRTAQRRDKTLQARGA
ncbi:MAG: hypothetical protein J3K34DRAFT_284114 [Monoraphidium minutum]|nr:MAG: hypothetical protein J3K34DRAFT_284114 [Monoraphidium minutum]